MMSIYIFLLAFIAYPSTTFFESVFETQFQNSPNFSNENNKFFIFFSGVPGMGKTTVASFLEKSLKGIRISADDARMLLRKELKYDGNDQEILLEEYIKFSIKKISTEAKNKCIIIDRSIDGIEKNMLEIANTHQSPYYLIRLQLPQEKVIERLKKREPNPLIHSQRMQRLKQWYREYHETPIKKFDFTLDMDEEFSEDKVKLLLNDIKRCLNKEISCNQFLF